MRFFVLAAIVFLALIVLGNAAFVVREDQQVIITQFGKPVGEAIVEPGLKFKIPFIQKTAVFDRRFLEWQGAPEELPTRDKVFIFVDVYARWRISDPLLFFQRLTDERGAQSRLDDIIDGETRNAIARHNLIEVIRSSNRTPELDESSSVEESFTTIGEGRDVIRQQILAAAQKRVAEAEADLGIEVLDVQFRRINYGEQVESDVYNRMISERKRIADRYRSQGRGEQARILGEMERDLKEIQSVAYKEAETIRGQADATATDVYARAYDRSQQARDFYEFLKTMESYQNTIDPDTVLMLSTDGDFYRYLKRSR